MKKYTIFLLCLLLCGCTERNGGMDEGLALRSELLNAPGCSLEASVTADYGNQTYTFAMGCDFDAHGNLSFSVTAPETIEGITGTIDAEGGALRFEDTALSFPLLADEQLSPISAPWIFMKTLRGGFITSAGEDNGRIRLIIDDSYEEDAFTVHIWLDQANIPGLCEIFWNGRRILSVTVSNFQIL